MTLADFGQLRQGCRVTEHREDRLGEHEFAGLARLGQSVLDCSDIQVWRDTDPGSAQPTTIDQRGVHVGV